MTSFVRWGDDSQIYIYTSPDGLACCECDLHPDVANYIIPPGKYLEHLLEHVRAGHAVPLYAFDDGGQSRNGGVIMILLYILESIFVKIPAFWLAALVGVSSPSTGDKIAEAFGVDWW